MQQTIDKQKYSREDLKQLIEKWLGSDRVPKNFKIVSDTSDFYRVDYNDVVVLDGKPYLIRNNEREGRFGIDEQQKFWVKRARDLTDGSIKILKLVFHERFNAKVGEIVFECFRSPKKEARILELTKPNERFMKGFSVLDDSGNIIRILDFIRGKTLAETVINIDVSHEEYYTKYFPVFFDEYIELVKAIQFLHDHNEKHGDIRRDHIIWKEDEGKGVWIDFDFNYLHKENIYGYDLFGLGNILVFITGGGDVTVQKLCDCNSPVINHLTVDDMNIIFKNRIVNLKKVFPYISDSLNLILMHFSAAANTFYENTKQFLDELQESKETLNN
jgi:hypothetical protein